MVIPCNFNLYSRDGARREGGDEEGKVEEGGKGWKDALLRNHLYSMTSFSWPRRGRLMQVSLYRYNPL